MKKSEKIGIITVIVLAVLWGVFFLLNQTTTKPNGGKIDCNNVCHKIASEKWFFPGSEPGIFFKTKEECVSECQFKFKK